MYPPWYKDIFPWNHDYSFVALNWKASKTYNYIKFCKEAKTIIVVDIWWNSQKLSGLDFYDLNYWIWPKGCNSIGSFALFSKCWRPCFLKNLLSIKCSIKNMYSACLYSFYPLCSTHILRTVFFMLIIWYPAMARQ